jgi:type II secretory pathway pseudopilin PulG
MPRRGLRSHQLQITTHKLPNPQSGYMLITLMLIMALAAMALLAVLPDMAQQIKRDREEEMCHRGTQYMRAIQHFYKKFGRYPTRIEELESTNNLRFLRKRYKDPMAHDQQGKEKDFRLLHMQDVNLGGTSSLAQSPGLGQALGNSLGQSPGLGQSSNSLGALGGAAAQNVLSTLQSQSGAGGTVQNNNNKDDEDDEPSANPQGNPSPGGSSGFNTGSTTGNGLNGTVFGGGPILGVGSTNKKDKAIRIYNNKDHYNDWMFIYDPTSDRGGLLVGPWQMPQTSTLPGATPAGQLTPGAQQPQSLGTPFGQSPSPQPPQAPQNQGTPNQ